MTKLKRGALIISGLALMASSASAGETQPAIVDVNMDAMIATGDMVSARTSKDDEVFIGCGTRNFELSPGGPLYSWAFCQAVDTDGDRATCFTTNSELVQTIREINSNSFITFGWSDDGAGNLTCTRMGFSTQSFYMDKHTAGNSKGNENK